MKERLTDRKAAAAKAPEGMTRSGRPVGTYIVWDEGQKGLGLRIGGRKKTWVHCYRNNSGVQRKTVLGAFPTVGIERARKLARASDGRVAEGKDPAAEKAEARRSDQALVKRLLDRYLAERAKRGLIAAKQEDRALRTGFGERLLHSDVFAMDRRRVAKLLEGIAGERGSGAAGYFRKAARTFFDWSLDRGLTASNPLAGYRQPKRTKAEKLLSDDKGRALSPAELAAVWRAADPASTFGRLVRFVMLTGCRRDEGASLEWSWIDRKASTVTLPAKLTKMGRDHVIPFTGALTALLDSCPKTASPLVFPAARVGRAKKIEPGEERLAGKIKGWSKLLPKLVERSGVAFTLHDLRRSIKTHVRELGFDSDVAGVLVGHARDSFEARYDRSQLLGLRAKAAGAYADMIEEHVRIGEGNVVELHHAI